MRDLSRHQNDYLKGTGWQAYLGWEFIINKLVIATSSGVLDYSPISMPAFKNRPLLKDFSKSDRVLPSAQHGMLDLSSLIQGWNPVALKWNHSPNGWATGEFSIKRYFKMLFNYDFTFF